MAGSGDLQVFRLLRFLRSRNSADGHANYGTQMAVSTFVQNEGSLISCNSIALNFIFEVWILKCNL